MTKHCIAFADEALDCLQLGPLHILAGSFVGKSLVQGQRFELADFILIQGADAQVADLLALDRLRVRAGRCVLIDSLTFAVICTITQRATLLRHHFAKRRTPRGTPIDLSSATTALAAEATLRAQKKEAPARLLSTALRCTVHDLKMKMRR